MKSLEHIPDYLEYWCHCKLSKLTEIKSCFEHLLSMFPFHLVNTKLWQSWIQGAVKDWGQKFCSRSFAKKKW